jgi:hypothetical protein
MPSLFRFLVILAIVCGVAYGAMYALANFLHPKERDITVSVPPDRFVKP